MEYKVFTAHLNQNNLALHKYDGCRIHLHLLVEKGHVDMTSSGTTYHLNEYDYVDCILETSVDISNPSADFRGWVMGIDRSEVPVFNQDLTIVPYNLISILYKNPVLHLSIQEFERLRHAFLSIERCLESNHMFKYQMLTRIIQLFMLELGQTLSLYDKTDTPTPSTRKAELFMQFTEEVRNHLATGRKVNSYAHTLHVSPQYLNAVIKEVSGETASMFIRKYVISHLISRITRKSTPLKQIAADFGFGDVSALYNYIKKHTGHTVPEIIEKNK